MANPAESFKAGQFPRAGWATYRDPQGQPDLDWMIHRDGYLWSNASEVGEVTYELYSYRTDQWQAVQSSEVTLHKVPGYDMYGAVGVLWDPVAKNGFYTSSLDGDTRFVIYYINPENAGSGWQPVAGYTFTNVPEGIYFSDGDTIRMTHDGTTIKVYWNDVEYSSYTVSGERQTGVPMMGTYGYEDGEYFERGAYRAWRGTGQIKYGKVGSIDGNMTNDIIVDWRGASARRLHVVNNVSADQELLVYTRPDRDDDGHPYRVRAGNALTLEPGAFTGFTITRESGTAGTVMAYWW